MDTLSFADIVQVIAAVITAVGLAVAAQQLRAGARIAQGQFLLSIDQLLDRFDDVHLPLRDALERSGVTPRVFTETELVRIKEYMGFLEFAEILIRERSITESAFRDLFAHRVRAIASSAQVMEHTVVGDPTRWRLFAGLMQRYGISAKAAYR